MDEPLQTRIHNFANVYLGLVALQQLANKTDVDIELVSDEVLEKCAEIGKSILRLPIDEVPPYIRTFTEMVKGTDESSTVYPTDIGTIAILHDVHPALGDDAILGSREMFPDDLHPLYDDIHDSVIGYLKDDGPWADLKKVATAPSITRARQSIAAGVTAGI